MVLSGQKALDQFFTMVYELYCFFGAKISIIIAKFSKRFGKRYLEFRRTILEEFLDNLNLAYRQRVFFQQDGGSAHKTQNVNNFFIDFLYGFFDTGEPFRWSLRFPNNTVMKFFFFEERSV